MRSTVGHAAVARVLVFGALGLGLVVQLHLAVTDDSVYWPDEIHKSVEAGHRAAFGYGWKPWEYVYGALNWTHGGLLAIALRILTAVGLDDPHRYVVVLRSLLVVVSVSAAWAVWRAVRDWDGSELAAAVAAGLAGLVAPVVYFSHRPLNEVTSMAPLAFGVWLTLRPGEQRGGAARSRRSRSSGCESDRSQRGGAARSRRSRSPGCESDQSQSRRSVIVGSALLGLAVLLRLQNVLLCATVLAVLAVGRDRSRLRTVAVVLAGAAAVYGIIDWITWGVPFHSAWEYVRWSVFRGVTTEFGTSPWWYYARFLLLAIGPVAVVLAGLVLAGARRAPGLAAVALVFLVAHSLVGHKEARFILATVPVLCMLAGLGLDEIARRVPGARGVLPAVAVLLLAPVAFQAITIERLTMRDIGQDHMFAASASAFAHSGEVNRLLFAASRRRDLCGIRVSVLEAEWTGGYTYLHRRVPFYDKRTSAEGTAGRYNYEITVTDPNDRRFVAVDGGYGLRRVADGCIPDRGFSSEGPIPAHG